MTVTVALLRGINVGGRNKVPMAELRAALAGVGLTDAQTYIQSGNIVVQDPRTSAEVGEMVHDTIRASFGLDIPVVTLSAAELRRIVVGSPYPDQGDPRKVHAIVLPVPATSEQKASIAERTEIARQAGSNDDVTVRGRVVYLHTPDGFGTSILAAKLTSGASAPVAAGTARNWATMTTLLEMCDGA